MIAPELLNGLIVRALSAQLRPDQVEWFKQHGGMSPDMMIAMAMSHDGSIAMQSISDIVIGVVNRLAVQANKSQQNQVPASAPAPMIAQESIAASPAAEVKPQEPQKASSFLEAPPQGGNPAWALRMPLPK